MNPLRLAVEIAVLSAVLGTGFAWYAKHTDHENIEIIAKPNSAESSEVRPENRAEVKAAPGIQ
ncbi:hypothetical protein [Pseudomonas sp. NPDC089569]|uniref:hypothetical protein n=1 Tax=Pseudomonas sp. NPDC089569 TaxID=3390722 RepID=UPI003D017B8E